MLIKIIDALHDSRGWFMLFCWIDRLTRSNSTAPIFQLSNVKATSSIPQAAGLALNSLPAHQTQLFKKPHARILSDPIISFFLSFFLCWFTATTGDERRKKENVSFSLTLTTFSFFFINTSPDQPPTERKEKSYTRHVLCRLSYVFLPYTPSQRIWAGYI